MKQWTDKYRPKSLDDLVGQSYVRFELRKFAADPYSSAWIFAGPPGTGKSSAAEALAHDIGVDPVANLITVPSGYLDSEGLDWLSSQFRFAPIGPPGSWRVVIIEEGDTMSAAAERKFLSLIDSGALPSRTVVIFTTNRPEWFRERSGGRFAERCELLEFAATPEESTQDIEILIQKVWIGETGTGADAPTIAELGNVLSDSGHVSYRKVVAALQRIHRERTENPAPFALRPAARPPGRDARPLLASCGPYGRKREPLARAVPAPEPAPAPVQDIKPTAAQVQPDPEPIELDLAANWTPTAVPTRSYRIERIQPDPTPDPYTAAQDWVRSCVSRPTVKSVAKRHGIAWATAARYVAEVFGPPPVRTAIYPKSNSRPPGPELQPATPAPRFWATPRGLVLNPGYTPDQS